MEVLPGILNRLAYVGVRSKKHDCIAAAKHRRDLGLIRNVANNEFKARRQLVVASGKIVVDDDVVTPAPQHVRCVAPKVPGTPNHENSQASSRQSSEYKSGHHS